MHMRTGKKSWLDPIPDKALIDIKKTNKTMHVHFKGT